MTLVLALLLEFAAGDPANRWHPVAWFGRFARYVERVFYASERRAGVIAWCVAVLAPTLVCVALLRGLEHLAPPLEIVFGAVVVWSALGWRSLLEHVRAVHEAPDLATAKEQVARIVGRETQAMRPVDVRRAALESLAENASDAVVATLFWAVVAGPTGALVHRLVNTLDALWGYRNERFERFGWCAARADDILNWVPARLTAALYLLVGGGASFVSVSEQARRHPSPNAGWPEAALAHVLGVRLGGPVSRRGHTEIRPWLGPPGSREPDVFALAAGLRATRRVLVVAALFAWFLWA